MLVRDEYELIRHFTKTPTEIFVFVISLCVTHLTSITYGAAFNLLRQLQFSTDNHNTWTIMGASKCQISEHLKFWKFVKRFYSTWFHPMLE